LFSECEDRLFIFDRKIFDGKIFPLQPTMPFSQCHRPVRFPKRPLQAISNSPLSHHHQQWRLYWWTKSR